MYSGAACLRCTALVVGDPVPGLPSGGWKMKLALGEQQAILAARLLLVCTAPAAGS